MNPPAEAQVQKKIAESPGGERVLRRRTIWRVSMLAGLAAALIIFFVWLGPQAGDALIGSFIANQLLILLLLGFGLVASSLLWSVGQRLDLWVFDALNLRGYHSPWMDRVMWMTTQLGSASFAAVIGVSAYLLGNRRFAIDVGLSTLTLWLLVELIKALTDRARPFNLLRETRVIGWRAPGLSFPSGHTAQTFLLVALSLSHFGLPPGIVLGLYAIAVLVAFTRVYVGAHYPRDVVAGAILGSVWGIVGVLVAPYF